MKHLRNIDGDICCDYIVDRYIRRFDSFRLSQYQYLIWLQCYWVLYDLRQWLREQREQREQ